MDNKRTSVIIPAVSHSTDRLGVVRFVHDLFDVLSEFFLCQNRWLRKCQSVDYYSVVKFSPLNVVYTLDVLCPGMAVSDRFGTTSNFGRDYKEATSDAKMANVDFDSIRYWRHFHIHVSQDGSRS